MRILNTIGLAAGLLVALGPGGCKQSEEPSAQARTIFISRCQPCHGARGQGNGAAAGGLVPRPRDYTDREWQQSVTDRQIAEIIVRGGYALGKSAQMPPNPDLADKPRVVDALVRIVRGFDRHTAGQ